MASPYKINEKIILSISQKKYISLLTNALQLVYSYFLKSKPYFFCFSHKFILYYRFSNKSIVFFCFRQYFWIRRGRAGPLKLATLNKMVTVLPVVGDTASQFFHTFRKKKTRFFNSVSYN